MHLEMNPPPGGSVLRYVGDRIRFTLSTDAPGEKAFLRTNLGRANRLHAEVVREYREELERWDPSSGGESKVPFTRGLAWRDVAMKRNATGWEVELALTEVGYFSAKAFVVDAQERQRWPAGTNCGITVHPNDCRTGNTIYCAFPRMFGPTKELAANNTATDPRVLSLDKEGYAVIPPSGKLRDLVKSFPHIFETLGCRVLQLLPVTPTPTTYARFGRYGSPYASEDLTAIDPALVEFDRRTTGVDQFRELTYAAHGYGARVLLDIVINHTGWGSKEQESHPEWFLHSQNGTFVSPGAWGITWEDLVEIDHGRPLPWDYLADVFITWCRRGVDGFRCDAGYKIPTNAWRYIAAKVRHEFPGAVFLLEGLGGSWEATEDLLTRGGMQWAYSELFQNYTPVQVSGYLDHAIIQNPRVGTLVHFSETHDNDRLAKKGRAWSLMRNQLSALASDTGGFAFTCGVEWLATEKINVHSSSGMSWGNPNNLLPELGRLNRLLAEHPCFFDGAKLRRLSEAESPVYVLERIASGGEDRVLVIVNLDVDNASVVRVDKEDWSGPAPFADLLTGMKILGKEDSDFFEFEMAPGQCFCLASALEPSGMRGAEYRKYRALHEWALSLLSARLEPEQMGPHNWIELARYVESNPSQFVALIGGIDPEESEQDLLNAIRNAAAKQNYPGLIQWGLSDLNRVTLVPPDHCILIQDDVRFRATLKSGKQLEHRESIEAGGRFIAAFWPLDYSGHPRVGDATLRLERQGGLERDVSGELRFLPAEPKYPGYGRAKDPRDDLEPAIALLTNGLGGMARICVDLGKVKSKYDCVLGANLNGEFPVDRHIFVKRIRIWANANGFISPLDRETLVEFKSGPPARWEFDVIAGDGNLARIKLTADMLQEANTTVFKLELMNSDPLPRLSLTVRFDIEDRNFHSQTEHNSGAEHHFTTNTKALDSAVGFGFRPASDRQLRVISSGGQYHPLPEWSHALPHSVEQTRGQVGAGDAFSPGWFELPMSASEPTFLLASAEDGELEIPIDFERRRMGANTAAIEKAGLNGSFAPQLALAAQAYVARRNEFKTVIAGYPWFLDWGRDSLICARGLLAGGMIEEVRDLLIAFGRFESEGTLPNTIHGADASNRDTSDAPLWYGIVCEELAEVAGNEIYNLKVNESGRTIRDVVGSIAMGYARGTPNGIRMDRDSGLVWSPSHFTWMDTNYPAGTPREGYPVEIQALWIRLLRQVGKIEVTDGENWNELAERAERSLNELFWIEEKGWLSDVLLAPRGLAARDAKRDDALRSNCLIPLTFGLLPGEKGRRCVLAAQKYLVIPGALRSLAPLPVTVPLPIYAADWRLLNNPMEPYWPRYEGDEDTQRKPAYHNGTAWTWTFPFFCEAIAKLWSDSPEALNAAKAYLGSMSALMETGCIGQIPEILDGSAPHRQRGCDAQAWGVTEALRVWKWLSKSPL